MSLFQLGNDPPKSRIRRARAFLASLIDTGPIAGTAWCTDCSMNHGETLVFWIGGIEDLDRHVSTHYPGDSVHVRGACQNVNR